jgi:hypothetical protein
MSKEIDAQFLINICSRVYRVVQRLNQCVVDSVKYMGVKMTKRMDAILKKYDSYMDTHYLNGKTRTCAFPNCIKIFPRKGTREFCKEHSELRIKERDCNRKHKLSEGVVDEV